MSYSYGTTPKKILKAALPETYPMELAGKDAALITKLVNQGIDSHLEAILLAEPAKLVGKPPFQKLKVVATREGMLCLLRRLLEESETEETDPDSGESAARDLRMSILSTVDIEEV